VKLPTTACALILAFLCARQGLAQTYAVVHAFAGGFDDGDTPGDGLALAGNTLYGTTQNGGSNLHGTIFRVNTDGTGHALLHSFDNPGLPANTNADGANPCARLISAESWLYGTACAGGSNGYGTVFKLNTNGTSFGVLKNFGGGDGANPTTGLVLSGTTLYGTTWQGGTTGFGTVFKLKTDGTGFTVLKYFADLAEGRAPSGGLALSGTTLYGTTRYGGTYGFGTVFRLSIDGSGFAVLKHFDGNDGGNVVAGLVLGGNIIYGATGGGSIADSDGLLFKMNVDGTSYSVIKRFTNRPCCTMAPGTLSLVGTTLYGATYSGGTSNCGTVFQINTDGTGYATLKEFSCGSDGANPSEGIGLGGAVPLVDGGVLYGTTSRGGSSDHGVVLSLTLPAGAPTILHSPLSQTVGVGYPVEFTVEAAGSPVLTYQWLFDVTNVLTGQTNAKLDLASAGLADAGAYTAVISNTFGVVTSAVATLTVLELPSFDVLHTFNGNDGWNANGTMTLSGATLYGTTAWGGIGYAPPGSFGYGEVFKIGTNGSGFTVFKQFTNAADGGDPFAGLVLSGSTLYGTTEGGGSNGFGTVFQINTDGSGFRVLKMFTGGDDGDVPATRPVVAGTALYGTTHASTYSGVVFKLGTDGTGYTVLKSFHTYSGDGAYPDGGLVLSDSTLYGTTTQGGSHAFGNVFRINTDSTGFAVLKEFSGSDGQEPHGDLLLVGGTLYGTTRYGGSSSYGTVFSINTDGTGFSVLKQFTLGDGAYPWAGLVLVGQTLVGTTSDGGYFGYGTVFKLNLDGSGFTVLKDFTGGSDGANPYAGLVFGAGTLFGTTRNGGTDGSGTIFSLTYGGQTTNRPPVASNITAATFQNQPLSLMVAKLLALASDPNGYSLVVTNVSPASTNGASVVLGNNQITYTPVAGYVGDDRFGYTVSDAFGASASACVFVQVRATNQISGNMLPLLAIPGGYLVSFAGIQGRTYSVQRAPTVTGPWATIATVSAGLDGIGAFQDTDSPPGIAFYRTTYP